MRTNPGEDKYFSKYLILIYIRVKKNYLKKQCLLPCKIDYLRETLSTTCKTFDHRVKK